MLYYVGVVVVLTLLFPLLMMQPQLSHMKIISTSSGGSGGSSGGSSGPYQISLTSFIASSSQPEGDHTESYITDAHSRCEELRRGRCEYWDWMELIESNTQQLHLTTAVQDVVEARRRADVTRGETRALAPWKPVDGTEDFFFTVEPEHLPLRWTQRLSVRGAGGAGPPYLRAAERIRGILASVEVCEQLRTGVSLSSLSSSSEAAQAHPRWLPLEGGGDDLFTLAELLQVLPNTSVSFLQEAIPRAKGSSSASSDTNNHDRIVSSVDAAEWVVRHGIELQVTSEFLNTIPQFFDESVVKEGVEESGTTRYVVSVIEQLASTIFLVHRFQPGPLQYLVCVKAVSSSPIQDDLASEDPAIGDHNSNNAIFSLFTAPADWSRKLSNLATAAATHDDDAAAVRKEEEEELRDLRLLRKTIGARIHFSSRVNIAVYDTATLLQFIGSTMGFVSLPWLLTEFLIGFFGSLRRSGPPPWFSRFLLRFKSNIEEDRLPPLKAKFA
ncbi:membrane-associated protein, putative [Bodo saltans]|uniref:Membrane-associated protein, putative n=1 Tax=Bodo saltans TaxID=75058 RepID=A0A0S4J3T3_BODSA|nr:membrane-associated protein, putative [Bodo saltans]|eukprot:CUG79508.1 membrane-associated protein, putative [Bodo saltans]